MTEFDAIKAAQEELSGLMQIRSVIVRVREAKVMELEQAEQVLNGMTKLFGFVNIEIEQKTKALVALREKLDAKPR